MRSTTDASIRGAGPVAVRSARIPIALLSFLLLLAFPLTLAAQTPQPGEGWRYFGTTGTRSPYDTLSQREAQIRSRETAGVFEGPIDATSYMMGPGDRLLISIPSLEARQVVAEVSPEGDVVLPRVGRVELRGRNLSQAERAIREAVSRVYRTSEATVTLQDVRRFKVSLIGDVRRPGQVLATPVTRVSEVIDLGGGVNTTASKRRIELKRGDEVIQVDLLPYYAFGDLSSNPYVQGGDRVQVGVQDPRAVVAIYGAVQRAGEFDYREGDSISSLIRYAFGLTADALRDSIEVTSVTDMGEMSHRTYHRVRPDGSVEGDRMLQRGDRVYVRGIRNYYRTADVVVAGEVLHPGTYSIVPGVTRLRDVVERSGGFTENASLADTRLIRRRAITQEFDQRAAMIREIDPDKRSEEEVDYLRSKSTERPGVMTVDFEALMEGSAQNNILLEDNDSLHVPIMKAYIKMAGKVKNPGYVTYVPGADYSDYIAMAGGYGWQADEGGAIVIKGRNEDTYPADSRGSYQLEPGDQIYVPVEKPGNFWAGFAQVVTIVAQIGTIAAVVVSIRGVN